MTIDKNILGGAKPKRTRKRGFIDWNPRDETRALLDQVQAVLDEYEEHLPLTNRQIFYRLVGAHDYSKTENAYNNLCEMLQKARRSRMIPFSAIRDDGVITHELQTYASEEDFLETERYRAMGYLHDHREGQAALLMLWCEAGGMVPQLAAVADDYIVPVFSSGGFDSLTAKYDFAEKIAEGGRPVTVLHIGDHDPSGGHLYLALKEDIEAFVNELGGEVEFTRLAVTPEQVKRLRLPTAPPKKSDKRAFRGQTCQAEAIAPNELARIVRDAIEARTDKRILDRVLKHEKRERNALLKRLK
jgi:hypothetical protein